VYDRYLYHRLALQRLNQCLFLREIVCKTDRTWSMARIHAFIGRVCRNYSCEICWWMREFVRDEPMVYNSLGRWSGAVWCTTDHLQVFSSRRVVLTDLTC